MKLIELPPWKRYRMLARVRGNDTLYFRELVRQTEGVETVQNLIADHHGHYMFHCTGMDACDCKRCELKI